MRMTRILLFAAVCAWLAAAAPSSTQARFKNLQVLDGVSEADLYAAMNFMAGSLGVTCEHCHVNPWDSDSREAKVTARRMITMVRGINDQSFEGRQVVTCQSCHRGSLRPATVPQLENAAWNHPSAPSHPAAKAPVTADQVVMRYFRAVNMSPTDARAPSRRLVGSFELTDGMRPPRTIPVEVLIGSAGQLHVLDRFPNRPSLTIWNGRDGWTKAGAGVTAMTAAEIEDARRTVEMYRVFDSGELKGLVVSEDGKGDPETVVLKAQGPGGHDQTLTFSTKTGLLMRRETRLASPLGTILERVDYAHYRRVNGVRVPFAITSSAFAQRMRFVFTRIDTSATIPAGAFDRPE